MTCDSSAWRKVKLSDVANYSDEKIPTILLNRENYVSTENMLPNKGGVQTAASLPSTESSIRYCFGQTLVSNIRPYFKKIWLADKDGGCSNDVLSFRVNSLIDNVFLYYLLSQDLFFDYVMKGATGTKMPRGNKKHILDFSFELPPRNVQEKIVAVLKGFDEKIAKNKAINGNLEEQMTVIFERSFNGITLNNLPRNWKRGRLVDFVEICNKTFDPVKEPEILLEHYSIPAYDDSKFPVFESSKLIKSNKFIIDEHCFLISKLNPSIKRVWRPYCISSNSVCSTEFIVYKAKEESNTDFLYSVINSSDFSDFMCSHVKGSTGSRQRTTPSETLQYEFIVPTPEIVNSFTKQVAPIHMMIKNNRIQNERLKKIRDALLPRLMSGELDVSEVEL